MYIEYSELQETTSKKLNQSGNPWPMMNQFQDYALWSFVLHIFDKLGLGALLLDESSFIRVVNDSARGKLIDSGLSVGKLFSINKVGKQVSAQGIKEASQSTCIRSINGDDRIVGEGCLVVSLNTDSENTFYFVLLHDAEQQLEVVFYELGVLYSLSCAERSVLRYISKGLSNKSIASKRNVSEQTVKTQLQSIFSKTMCSSRTELSWIVLARAIRL